MAVSSSLTLKTSTAITVMIAAALIAAPSYADPLDSVYACSDVENADDRLACYDQAVGRLQQAEATGEIRTISRAEVQAVERDAFGFNLPNLPNLLNVFGGSNKSDKAPKESDLTAPVQRRESDDEVVQTAEITPNARPSRPAPPPLETQEVREIIHGLRKTEEFGGSKRTRFYLDNGQVWDQADTRRVRIPKVRNGQSNTVEIRKAALGSFLLRINGEGAAVRVRRRR